MAKKNKRFFEFLGEYANELHLMSFPKRAFEESMPEYNSIPLYSCISKRSPALYSPSTGKFQRFTCKGKYCPFCHSDQKKKLALEHADFFMGLMEEHSIEHMHRMVFTAPDSLRRSDIFVKYRKEIAAELKKLVNNMLGFPTRADVPMYVILHPFGDKSNLEFTYHFHVGFLPIMTSKDKNGNAIVTKGCVPQRYSEKLKGYVPSFDLELLRRSWWNILRKFENDAEKPINPQVMNISFFSPEQIVHGFVYDYRSFLPSFWEAIEDKQGDLLIINGKKVTEKEFFEKMHFYRCNRWASFLGSMNMRKSKKKLKVFGIELTHKEEEMPDDFVHAVVVRNRGSKKFFVTQVFVNGEEVHVSCERERKYVSHKKKIYKMLDYSGVPI